MGGNFKNHEKCVGLATNVVVVKWLCPFSLWSSAFLLEQNLRGWTSIISGAVEVERGLSDSCRFSWHPHSLQTSRSISYLSIRVWHMSPLAPCGRCFPSTIHRLVSHILNWAW